MSTPRTADPGRTTHGGHGSIGAADESDEARIGRKIQVQPNGCWIYAGNPDAYANTTVRDGERVKVYRWVYELLVGPIPEGHDIHHRCRNKRCCNPEHLEALTHADHLALHGGPRLPEPLRRLLG